MKFYIREYNSRDRVKALFYEENYGNYFTKCLINNNEVFYSNRRSIFKITDDCILKLKYIEAESLEEAVAILLILEK